MKKLSVVLFLFLIANSIIAQGLSFGLKLKGRNNLYPTYLFAFEGNYGIDKYNLSLGAEITLLYGSINPAVINNPPPTSISDLAYGAGITGKYYLIKSKSSTSIKPFVGIGIGYYFPSDNLYMEGMMIECEEDYKFNSSYDFYTDLDAGLLFFSRSMFSITLELTYQLRYPKVKYRKFINCSTVEYGKPLIPVEYSESVNLSMLLWSIGIQVNL